MEQIEYAQTVAQWERYQAETMEVCVYCGLERNGKLDCCGEVHFEFVTVENEND